MRSIKIIYFPLMFWATAMVPWPDVILVAHKHNTLIIKKIYQCMLEQRDEWPKGFRVNDNNWKFNGQLLIFVHELWHIKQFRVLGKKKYYKKWMKGWFIKDPHDKPIERKAYENQYTLFNYSPKKLYRWVMSPKLTLLKPEKL